MIIAQLGHFGPETDSGILAQGFDNDKDVLQFIKTSVDSGLFREKDIRFKGATEFTTQETTSIQFYVNIFGSRKKTVFKDHFLNEVLKTTREQERAPGFNRFAHNLRNLLEFLDTPRFMIVYVI